MGTELAQSIKKTENGQPEAATEGRTGTRQTDTGATGWKAEVKAELKAHRGRLIVCALIGILLLAFLIGHKSVFEEPWGTNINLAADYGTIPLQEGHELSQSFRSEGQHLDQLFLWIEGAASAGDPGEAQGVIYFRSSGSAALEMPAVGDGGTLEDGITVVFDYERMNKRAFARAIFLVLVLVVLLAVPASFVLGILRKISGDGHGTCGTLAEQSLVEENRQKLSMLASAAVLFLGPVFTYWLVEYAGGNWGNVSKSYGLYNILWYFLFYAAIYVVTDRAAWAAAIVNPVFLALAAANYFVLQFRGKPVLPWELKAAKTAATVAGGYDLHWTQQLLTGVLAFDGEAGLREFQKGCDAAVLDIMLPKKNGFELCREIRKTSDIPILLVTAKKEDIDKIRGLGLGADDYVVKPFSPAELVARVKAHIGIHARLGQREQGSRQEECLAFGDLKIYPKAYRVFLKDKEIALANREFELLLFLASNPNIVFSKETLFERIWGMDALGDSATVMVHVNRIREKLKDPSDDREYIQTVWGAGYRFCAE